MVSVVYLLRNSECCGGVNNSVRTLSSYGFLALKQPSSDFENKYKQFTTLLFRILSLRYGGLEVRFLVKGGRSSVFRFYIGTGWGVK